MTLGFLLVAGNISSLFYVLYTFWVSTLTVVGVLVCTYKYWGETLRREIFARRLQTHRNWVVSGNPLYGSSRRTDSSFVEDDEEHVYESVPDVSTTSQV